MYAMTIEPGDTAASAGAPHTVRARLLGPLELHIGDVDRAPSTPKLLQLLAMLLIRPGRTVHVDSLVHELWNDAPPRSVRRTLHTYVHHLRRHLDPGGTGDLLVTSPPGYRLEIDAGVVDVWEFQRLQRLGRELLEEGDDAAAAHAFRTALDLWSGPPLANIHCGPTLAAYTVYLLEHRREARDLWIDAEIRAGRHREMLGVLRSLTTADPFDETLHAHLIRALGLSGRRSDALASYEWLRTRLEDELGVKPSAELRELHRELLSEGHPVR
ncbi:SARP family transcriptional regulator [Amycolatopsis sp. WAC 04182]|uniref:AfsR/SARP family transcriptional regulator n=1 Tax=Amycolatopsis sp. WAC 04182 TaxID=2203198 RepID=UPI000F778834|nr:AfsR/SARP family transcriptional regulator [Amycolatopsis sp. WAC 04182]RSN63588.1 SARP family transcriptional regulator [Amycolatopsis sp. WAC 04182]